MELWKPVVLFVIIYIIVRFIIWLLKKLFRIKSKKDDYKSNTNTFNICPYDSIAHEEYTRYLYEKKYMPTIYNYNNTRRQTKKCESFSCGAILYVNEKMLEKKGYPEATIIEYDVHLDCSNCQYKK